MHLTTDQAQQVHDRLRPTLGYLTKLERRMHELRLAHNNPLYDRVVKAQRAGGARLTLVRLSKHHSPPGR